MSVITLDDLNTYMVGKTVDPGLGQIVVDQMNDYVDNQTGRYWGETKQVTERYNYGNNTWLRATDILSVDAVTLGWPGQTQTTVPASSYMFSRGNLRLYGIGSGNSYYRDFMSVTYTYGSIQVPDDLKAAVLALAAQFYTWAGNDQKDVASVAVGSYRIEYANKRVAGGGGKGDPATTTADANRAMIQSYRRVKV